MRRFCHLSVITLSAFLLSCDAGCAGESDKPDRNSGEASAKATKVVKLPPAQSVELSSLRHRQIETSKAFRQTDCHRLFSADGLESAADSVRLASARCHPEVYLSDSNRLYIGFRPGPETSDLQLHAYTSLDEKPRKPDWSATFSRPKVDSFKATFSGTKAVIIEPFLCLTSRFLQRTIAGCYREGKNVWNAVWDFETYSGPHPVREAFVLTKRKGLSRRYPFTGEEIRFHGFAAIDRNSLIAARDKDVGIVRQQRANPPSPTLDVYDLKNGRLRWQTPGMKGVRDLVGPSQHRFVVVFKNRLAGVGRRNQWHIEFPRDIADIDCRQTSCIVLLTSTHKEPGHLVQLSAEEGSVSRVGSVRPGFVSLSRYGEDIFVESLKTTRSIHWRQSHSE